MKDPYTIPIVFYGVACILPIFKGSNILGIHALSIGWWMLGEFPISLLWLANLSFFLSLILPDYKRKEKIGLSVITLLFGLTFFWIDGSFNLGSPTDPVLPGMGYYFWMCGFLHWFFSLILKKQVA